jgi:hypothetical protein
MARQRRNPREPQQENCRGEEQFERYGMGIVLKRPMNQTACQSVYHLQWMETVCFVLTQVTSQGTESRTASYMVMILRSAFPKQC